MTDTVKAWIEERQSFQNNRYVDHNAWYDATRDAVMEFPYALDALNAVLKLHEPKYLASDGEWVPGYCKECYSHNWSWPCPTVQAIEDAIKK